MTKNNQAIKIHWKTKAATDMTLTCRLYETMTIQDKYETMPDELTE